MLCFGTRILDALAFVSLTENLLQEFEQSDHPCKLYGSKSPCGFLCVENVTERDNITF